MINITVLYLTQSIFLTRNKLFLYLIYLLKFSLPHYMHYMFQIKQIQRTFSKIVGWSQNNNNKKNTQNIKV